MHAWQGALAPVSELCRLMEVLDQRTLQIEFLTSELAQQGCSFKLRETSAKIAAVGEPPIDTPPTNPNDMPAWNAWLERARAAVVAFGKACHGMESIERYQAAQQELENSHCRTALLEVEHTELSRHVDSWLECEGALRVIASLMQPQRLRLKRMLLGKRSDAYRRMCAEPVDTKLQFKAATRELAVVVASETLAAEIESSVVQDRTYIEASVMIRVLDGREKAKLAELVPDDSSAEALERARENQESLASSIALYLGETRDDRLYVREVKRISIKCSYSTGDVDEPGTEAIIGVKRETGKERAPTMLLQQILVAHDSGALCEVWH